MDVCYIISSKSVAGTLQWCHNERDGIFLITSLTIVHSTIYSGIDQRKQSFGSLAFVRGIHRWPVNSPHKWPVTRKLFPLDDVIVDFVMQMLNNKQQESVTATYTRGPGIRECPALKPLRINTNLKGLLDHHGGIQLAAKLVFNSARIYSSI